MSYRKTITVYCKNSMEYMNSVRGRNTELSLLKYLIRVSINQQALKGVWAGYLSRYSDWLRAGRFEDRIPVGARFSAPIQIGPGGHTDSCSMGNGSFPEVKGGWGVTLIPHPLLVPWSRKSRAIPLLPLWAVRLVQSQCL